MPAIFDYVAPLFATLPLLFLCSLKSVLKIQMLLLNKNLTTSSKNVDTVFPAVVP